MSDDAVDPLKERKIGHCATDLMRAREEGRFAIETPGVYMDKDDIERLQISYGRDTDAMGRGVHTRVYQGPPYIELSFEYTVDEYPPRLYEDTKDHAGAEKEHPIVVYGDMHLWQMFVGEMKQSVDTTIDGKILSTADFDGRWYDVETVGWR